MVSRHRVRIALTITAVSLIAVLVLAVAYLQSLFSLVKPSDFTGDPSVSEINLADPEELLPIGTTDPGLSIPATGSGWSMNGQTRLSDSVSSTAPSEPATPSVLPHTVGSNKTKAIPTTTSRPIPSLYDIPSSRDVYNILLIGTDTRGDGFTGRSDAMMILSVNRRTKKIHLVSLTRGMYVAIDGHDRSMLNNAYSWGGARLLLQTIRDNLRVAIDDYVVINFNGFKQAVDLVGGVSIDLTQAEVDYLYLAFPDGSFQVGSNRLQGAEALCYARIRKIDSDYKRTGRQRRVMVSLISQMEKLSATKLDALVRKLLPLVKTNLSGSRMVSLAVNALAFKSYPVRQLMLPISGTFKTIVVRGVQMTEYDEATNIEALHHFLYSD